MQASSESSPNHLPFKLSLRKHPFLDALRHWGRFALSHRRSSVLNVPSGEERGRNGCFHRLPQAELLDEYKQLRGFNLALPPNSHFFLQNIYTSGGIENNDTDISPPFKFLAEGTAEVGNHSTGPPKL